VAEQGFAEADALVVEIEKMHANNPLDPGGDTWWGVSRLYHPDEEPWPPSEERTREIRRAEYWDALGCNDMPWSVALSVYDFAILQGAHTAALVLQHVVGVAPDGRIGPRTLGAVARRDLVPLLHELYAQRTLQLAQSHNWGTFGHGWMVRLFQMHTLAMEEAVGGNSAQA
jgi:lysozyme family protein